MIHVPAASLAGATVSVVCGVASTLSDNATLIIISLIGQVTAMIIAGVPIYLSVRASRKEIKASVVGVHDELLVVKGEIDGKMTKLLEAKDEQATANIAAASAEATLSEKAAEAERKGIADAATLAAHKTPTPVEVVNEADAPVPVRSKTPPRKGKR